MRRLVGLVCAALSAGCTSSANKPVDAGTTTDVAVGCQDVDGPIPGTAIITFDTDVEQFTLDTVAGGTLTNVAAADAGVGPATLSYDGTEGNPTPGSLEIVAPFNGPNQDLIAYRFIGCTAPVNWTDRVVHARIKVAAGDFSQVALLYVATSTDCTTYSFAYGAYARLERTSCWQELTLDLTSPGSKIAGYDPSTVTAFGIQIYSGQTDADITPATFLVDSFSVQ